MNKFYFIYLKHNLFEVGPAHGKYANAYWNKLNLGATLYDMQRTRRIDYIFDCFDSDRSHYVVAAATKTTTKKNVELKITKMYTAQQQSTFFKEKNCFQKKIK